MKCGEIKTLLNSYVDNEVAQADAKQVKKHLGECPACAKEAAELKKVKGMLRGLPALTAPPELLEEVMCHLARPNAGLQQRNETFSRYRWLTLSLASAAAVILVVFTVMIHSRKNEIQNQTPAGRLTKNDAENARMNLKTSVAAKTSALDAIQAQPMLFTQQINISAKNVDTTVAQVYALASTQTPDLKLRAEYQKKQAAREELLAKASDEQPIQDENPTASNSVAPMRGQKSQQQRQLGQTVKISIPLSQKDAFIKQLKGGINITDRMVLFEMQVIAPNIQQQGLSKEGFLAAAGETITEGEERQAPDSKHAYDKMARSGGRDIRGKQAEPNKNKIEGGKSDEAKDGESNDTNIVTTGPDKNAKESLKDKPAEQPKTSPTATAPAPPPPGTPSPAPSAPPTNSGKPLAEKKEEILQEKNKEKRGDADAISQTSRVQPEPMIELIIVIEPTEK